MFKRGAFVPAAPVQPVTLKCEWARSREQLRAAVNLTATPGFGDGDSDPFCFHDVSWTPDSSLVKVRGAAVRRSAPTMP